MYTRWRFGKGDGTKIHADGKKVNSDKSDLAFVLESTGVCLVVKGTP